MGSQERRDRERAETRNKILDAARVLFVEHGYAAVTMRKIAERIDYTPPAIYFHFADKTSLIRELVVADFAALAAKFHKIALVADPVERLRRTGEAYVEFGLSHPNHYRLMFMQPSPELPIDAGRGADVDGYLFLREGVALAIAQHRFCPELDDAELVAQVFWAGVHGIVSLHLAKAGDPGIAWRSAKHTTKLMLDTMVRGLAGSPRSSRRTTPRASRRS